MKKNLRMIVLLLSSWMAFNACSSSKDEEVVLTVNPNSVAFSAEGGERDVTVITTAQEWRVSSDAEWCKVGERTENKVTLIADPYNELTARTAKVTVYAKGALDQVVEIRQAAAAAATLVLDPNELTEFAAKDPVSQKIVIESNQSEIVVDRSMAEWCHVSLADDKGSLTVSVDPSKEEARETVFKVIAGVEPNQIELPITVKQADGTVKIELEDKEVELNALGVKTIVKLKADSDDWIPQLEEGVTWCSVEKTQDGQGLVLTGELNLGGSEREAKITLAKDVELTVYQTGEKLEMGDFLYMNKKAVGIVIEHDNAKKQISVMALEEKKDLIWNKAECNDYVNSQITYFDSNKGKYTLEEIKKQDNWKENYPLFAYCAEMDEKTGLEGWYIPTNEAMGDYFSEGFWKVVKNNYSILNEKLAAKGYTEIDQFTMYWSSLLPTNLNTAYACSMWITNRQYGRQDTGAMARCFWRYTYE